MTAHNLKKTFSNWISELKRPIHLKQRQEMAATPHDGERDETFDVLKGIAIILVIVGHTDFGPFRAFIYSFHMPLFFFIAGYFLKKRPLQTELCLSAKRLLIPYLFTAFWFCIAATYVDPSRLQDVIVVCLLGFRAQYVPDWINGHIGILWFFWALFWAKIIVSVLVHKIKSETWLGIIFFVFALLGIFLNKRVFVPFCIPQGMCAAGFLFVGYLIKKYNVLGSVISAQIFPLLTIIWAYNWNNGGVDMYNCIFRSGYILDLMGAVAAFIALHTIVKQSLNSKSFLWNSIRFWGRYSIIIYSVHSVEYSVAKWKTIAYQFHIPLDYISLFSFSARMALVFIISYLFIKIAPIRKQIFQIK